MKNKTYKESWQAGLVAIIVGFAMMLFSAGMTFWAVVWAPEAFDTGVVIAIAAFGGLFVAMGSILVRVVNHALLHHGKNPGDVMPSLSEEQLRALGVRKSKRAAREEEGAPE